MDKKIVITILLAAILALFIAYLIFDKSITDKSVENVSTPQEEVVVQEDVPTNETITEEIIEQNNEVPAVKKVEQPIKKEVSKTPVFDQIVVQEGSVVEEAEPDYGIKKVGNAVEITREFKVKSPTNYSFKDFGILDKVTTK